MNNINGPEGLRQMIEAAGDRFRTECPDCAFGIPVLELSNGKLISASILGVAYDSDEVEYFRVGTRKNAVIIRYGDVLAVRMRPPAAKVTQ
jgi:hypothetical protein